MQKVHLKLMIKLNKKLLKHFNQQKILNMEYLFIHPINQQVIDINLMNIQSYKWELMFLDQLQFLFRKYYGHHLIIIHLILIINLEWLEEF